MRVAIVLLLLVLVGASAFVTLNWGAVITPTDLSLGVGMVRQVFPVHGLFVRVCDKGAAGVHPLDASPLCEARKMSSAVTIWVGSGRQAQAPLCGAGTSAVTGRFSRVHLG